MSNDDRQSPAFLRVRVGCEFLYESAYPTPMVVLVRPRQWRDHRMLREYRTIDPEIPIDESEDSFGNHLWRIVAPVGLLHLRYDALVEVPSTPDRYLPGLRKTPIEELPSDVLVYTLPSRHCQSDLFIADAWNMFGHINTGWEQVQAVCDWIHTNIKYEKGSTATTSSYDVFHQRRGVCRDFAHLGVTLCRALNFPARYVCGYLPDINVEPDPTPMDFHAWFQVYMQGEWHTFDARHNRQRTGRTLIAAGRDAVDTALATIYGGTELAKMTVWADEVAPEFELPSRSIRVEEGAPS
ncbi:MAG: transglutaminase family protein [Herpetosiphon sp.]